MLVHDQSQEGIVLYAFGLPFIRGLEGDQPGDVGLYAGDAGEYVGDVGEYAGDNGEYLGEAGLPKGEVGEYLGDEGDACAGEVGE